jgi:hypothetical protein
MFRKVTIAYIAAAALAPTALAPTHWHGDVHHGFGHHKFHHPGHIGADPADLLRISPLRQRRESL